MFAFLPERLRSAYLWLAFFAVPGAGFVLSGVPGADPAAKSVLAVVVVHHSLFLLYAVLSGVR
ncbi:MAG: hypothetical protein ABEJ79_06540 [Halolamina sp.]